MTRASYGLDAPHVVRNLFLFGIAGLVIYALVPHRPALAGIFGPALGFGVCLTLEAFLMLWTSFGGKKLARNKLLSRHAWRGDERVLDVGCGRGLLLIGAAKRLSTGTAVGLDLWNAEDLSGNGRAATEANIQVEGVAARVELVDGDAAEMPFADASFDVVVSSLCIHNLYDPAKRAQALAEILRVLKPGGRLLIQDFRHTGVYVKELQKLGAVEASRHLVNPFWMFPPTMRVEGGKAL